MRIISGWSAAGVSGYSLFTSIWLHTRRNIGSFLSYLDVRTNRSVYIIILGFNMTIGDTLVMLYCRSSQHSALPCRRLWFYLISQEHLHPVFRLYLFGKKNKPPPSSSMEVVCLTVPYYCVLPGVPSLSSLYSFLKYTELVEWLLMIIKTSNQQ